jgi:hypothetical protein
MVLLLTVIGCVALADTLVCPAGCPDEVTESATETAPSEPAVDSCMLCQGTLTLDQYSPDFTPQPLVRLLLASFATGPASPPPARIEYPPRCA